MFKPRFSVTPAGFKPATFASVVRCSIQLSYGAGTTVFLIAGAKVLLFSLYTKFWDDFFKNISYGISFRSIIP